eukprot:CAMPEP_0206245340 /NCGR_PEP_ID=MMETSP0047_2-20121206/18643_1 /ASSEMBLY_ACC=CAM_ASM_000192 /TAXON_ID=195065 /ORGANISM="Chroomonas mesostigmatica_cf, Strain CCMP1168" /LENGTH=453 /DNA_ID=CAMNT_0053670629 /DNA_START=9 /DNA_END=1370 /DNA_ORIENTATION=-
MKWQVSWIVGIFLVFCVVCAEFLLDGQLFQNACGNYPFVTDKPFGEKLLSPVKREKIFRENLADPKSQLSKFQSKTPVSMYYINLHSSTDRRKEMTLQAKKLRKVGVMVKRVAAFPIREAEFISQLRTAGKIHLNCTDHKIRPTRIQSIVDLCETEGLNILSVDLGMFWGQFPFGFQTSPRGSKRTVRALGALGCSISHLLALRRAFLAGDWLTLVSEDDVTWDPFTTLVKAKTELVQGQVDPAATAASEALAYIQAVVKCAATQAGARKQPWRNTSARENVKMTKAESVLGMVKPVVVQMATSNQSAYKTFKAPLNRNEDCVKNRNGCHIVQRRHYNFWGTQGLLWNQAAVQYMVHLFWEPHSFSQGVSKLSFPRSLPSSGVKEPYADHLFYNLAHPFGDTFFTTVPACLLQPRLSFTSTISQGPANFLGNSSESESLIRQFSKYFSNGCTT